MSGMKMIRVGLCAMPKKVKSKPMNEILKGLIKTPFVKLITFDEKMILNDPIEKWPVCEVLISFYSHNFPLDKAIAYAELRHPYLINDLKLQQKLLNRKLVYEVLEKHGIPVPKYIFVDRENSSGEVVELDDAIEWNGEIIHKPFVEKPIDAEDHNIYIYFPSTAGGGRQQLFRKVGDRSSKYCPQSSVRSEGSYLYETFMPTDGTDVKIYTVGEDYAHAEARKSPALDGKVERDSEGKEVRYPVILTLREKMIAKKVSLAFQQQICGFDLLRANGMSYVCDVNGFSFVKSSPKYYEDCAHILLTLITRRIAPHLSTPRHLQPLPPCDTSNLVPTTSGSIMELRCVIGVIRHGDRTPKQKLKMEVRDERFWRLYHKYSSERTKELKLKKPKQLQEVLDIVRDILTCAESDKDYCEKINEQRSKYQQIRNVLEMYGHFSGINRKIQMKKRPPIPTCTNPQHLTAAVTSYTNSDNISSGTTSTSSSLAQCELCNNQGLVLIIKWGGELTDAGRLQAEKLGKAFRRLYPSGNGNYDDDSGLGLLRLHSTYRHDLKIYASDEGRVQMTAAAFAKGFLALEGELPPILVQMVKSANTNGLLDNDNDCRHYQMSKYTQKVMVKKKIFETMSQNRVLDEEDLMKIAPTQTASLINALRHIGNPAKTCDQLMNYLINLNFHLSEFSAEERASIPLYHEETWELLQRRWRKLLKDFKAGNSGGYDLSKISDIYDNIKYDIQHNPNILIEEEEAAFFVCAKSLADVIVPQEYGVTVDEKLVIGQRICTPLLRKILCDARYTDVDECTRLHAGYSKGVASPERFVRTRLYFTSESHLHALINTIRYGDLAHVDADEQWQRAMEYVNSVTEMNYLSQIVIMIFEDPHFASKSSKDRFHVEIHFSPGAFTGLSKPVTGGGYRPQNLERHQSTRDCCENNVNVKSNSAATSKPMSRSSSINDKPPNITPPSAGVITPGTNASLTNNSGMSRSHYYTEDATNSGFNMRDLWSKFSRSKKKASSRSSSSSNSSSTIYRRQFESPTPSTTHQQTPELTSNCIEDPTTHNNDKANNDDSAVTITPNSVTANAVLATSISTAHAASSTNENLASGVAMTTSSTVASTLRELSTVGGSRFTVTSVDNSRPVESVNVPNNEEYCLYHRSNLSPDMFKSKNFDMSSRKMSLARENSSFNDSDENNPNREESNQEINYLTYPASEIAMFNCSARMVSTSRPLISTDVIKGAKSYSTGSIPDINSYFNDGVSDFDDRENKEKESQIIIPNAPCVPEIYSLETLHNALNLNDIENFLQRLVSQKYTTPCESPK